MLFEEQVLDTAQLSIQQGRKEVANRKGQCKKQQGNSEEELKS
jgi:hypothetical protein